MKRKDAAWRHHADVECVALVGSEYENGVARPRDCINDDGPVRRKLDLFEAGSLLSLAHVSGTVRGS